MMPAAMFQASTHSAKAQAVLAVCVYALLPILAPSPGSAQSPPANDCVLVSGDARTVVRIVDAETIGLDDGREVRLVGALAPRPPLSASADENWPPETEAVDALRRLLSGKTVELAVVGRRADRYGRTLAQAFVIDGNERTWVQGRMLSEGHGRAYALPESVACLEALVAREKSAREARRGLWASAAYAVRQAGRPGELMRLRSTFQIVEGTVETAADVKGSIYLNFGADWHSDFTAGVAHSVLASQFRGTDQPALLKGRKVRVRGWIERRNGPFIEIIHPGQIEVLDASSAVAEGRAGNEKRPNPVEGPGVP